MNWKKWLSMGLTAVLVLSASDTGMVKAGGEEQQTVAYIDIADTWGVSYQYGSDSTQVVASNATVTGDGQYTVSVDFSQTSAGICNGINQAKICIKEGEKLFGSDSLIKITSLKLDANSLSADNTGYTYGNQDGDTCMWLYSKYSNPYWDSYYNGNFSARIDDGSELQQENTKYKPFGDSIDQNFTKMEITFEFITNSEGDPNVTKDPNASPDATPTNDPNITPGPSASAGPDATPTNDPNTTPEPSASADPYATPTNHPDMTPDPQGTSSPNLGGQNTIVSNSTYTGPEKILLRKNAVVVPAGKSTSITFALLRSAASKTKVTASSANTKVAIPVLQSDGKVSIQVPAAATAGSSTTVALRFGSSSATVKVTVDNPVTKIKAAKKSYKVKRKKKVKTVFYITKQNKSAATTQEVSAKISGKKASVSSVKLSGSKLTVKIKGVKKGNATLKVKIGSKTAKTKIKVK
ncbi:MAG: hypothetical protein Q4D32_09950 [Eubacteriales bacterium]|nr:hypothetical protein [Eubacteriales bacterium]